MEVGKFLSPKSHPPADPPQLSASVPGCRPSVSDYQPETSKTQLPFSSFTFSAILIWMQCPFWKLKEIYSWEEKDESPRYPFLRKIKLSTSGSLWGGLSVSVRPLLNKEARISTWKSNRIVFILPPWLCSLEAHWIQGHTQLSHRSENPLFLCCSLNNKTFCLCYYICFSTQFQVSAILCSQSRFAIGQGI